MTATPLPKGFQLSVASAGFKTPGRKDLALAVSDGPAVAAAMFTTNLFKAAPVLVGQETLGKKNACRAVLINTGQANACTGDEGLANCRATRELIARELAAMPGALSAEDILPASTGVIGAQLKMDLWEKAVPALAANLGKASPEDFAAAIMTTDSFPKLAAEELVIEGKTVTITGFAKGAGMICPNMATMISVVLCDAAVSPEDWKAVLGKAIQMTFNRATVDGDTSTNDTVYALANGASGVSACGANLAVLEAALIRVLGALAYKLVQDGEGATKVLHIHVSGASDDAAAETAARTVGHSQLVKTAMYGKDANWGRIVAALGRSGVSFAPEDVRVSLCGVEIFAHGGPASDTFDEELKEPLEKRDITIDIVLGAGAGRYDLLASDLTHEYVNINADYRS